MPGEYHAIKATYNRRTGHYDIQYSRDANPTWSLHGYYVFRPEDIQKAYDNLQEGNVCGTWTIYKRNSVLKYLRYKIADMTPTTPTGE